MNQDNRNLVLAIVCSALLVIAYQIFFELPKQQRLAEQNQKLSEELSIVTPEKIEDKKLETIDDNKVNISAPRINIDNPSLTGSITLAGARIDDIILKNYTVTNDPLSDKIKLLKRTDEEAPYFVELGWISADNIELPNDQSLWQSNNSILEPNKPITLKYKTKENLEFIRTIEVNENYILSISDKVINNYSKPVNIFPYGLIRRTGLPKIDGLFILHEGPLAVIDEQLHEVDYNDLVDDGDQLINSENSGGWIGITDKYWLAALVPDQSGPVNARFIHNKKDGINTYQVDFVGPPQTVAPGNSIQASSRVFAGAKEVRLLDAYEEQVGVKRFDLAIDFGWFYFLTKPIFYALLWLNDRILNLGLAILVLTVGIKLAFFPLANKSYVSMSKMKILQPKMVQIRERFSDDKMRMNQEMMDLYKKEKVNPASGCLPILVQIPVFFALYKVLFVTIEMRHAPFYGWIEDLSAPDPTSLFNLFGLINYCNFNKIQISFTDAIERS